KSPHSVQSPKSKVQSQDRQADFGHWTLDIGQKHSRNPPEIFSLPLLVRNRTGYQNLCRLITLMKLRVPKHAKPGECVVRSDELAAHAKGLICLTGSFDGPIATAINPRDARNAEKAQGAIDWLLELFGKK